MQPFRHELLFTLTYFKLGELEPISIQARGWRQIPTSLIYPSTGVFERYGLISTANR
jgi:hypothetical protein